MALARASWPVRRHPMEATSPSSIPSSCTACSPCGQPSGPTRPTARGPLRPHSLQASMHRPLWHCQQAPLPAPHLPLSLAPRPLSSPSLTRPPLSSCMGAVAVGEQQVGQQALEGPRLPPSSLTLLPLDPPRNASTHPLPLSLQPHPPARPLQFVQPPLQGQPLQPQRPPRQRRPRAGIPGLGGP